MIVYVVAVLAALGFYGILTRRDIVAILGSVEIVLGAATLLLVSLSATMRPGFASAAAVAVLVLAAVEAVVGIALVSASVRRTGRGRLDELEGTKG
jgi:NADH-quinone oxidoreductase subunit K